MKLTSKANKLQGGMYDFSEYRIFFNVKTDGSYWS